MQHIKIPLTAEYFGQKMLIRDAQYINRIANGIAWRQQQFGE